MLIHPIKQISFAWAGTFPSTPPSDVSPSEVKTVTAAANRPPITILVVEDDAIIRMVTADVLGEAGYNVIEAVNASEALELLDARPDISLMLTDVRMPGELDGYNLSRLVRMKYAAMGIIVISGDSPPGESDLPQGARFLPKPLLPSVLLEAVRETIAQGPAAPNTEIREQSLVPQSIMTDATLNPTGIGTNLAQPLAKPDKN
jgi:two-component system, response regulator PdtaR